MGGICMQFSVGTFATDLFAKVKTKTQKMQLHNNCNC